MALKTDLLPIKSILILILFVCHSTLTAQWVQTNGPEGGYTKDIVQTGDVLVLSAVNGGVYTSNDHGVSWVHSSDGLPCNRAVSALATYGGFVYAAVAGSGLFLSDDEGATWTPINSGIENITFFTLAVSDLGIFAGSAQGGVFYSSDNGQSWSDRSSGIEDQRGNDILIVGSRVYFAGNFLYESLDNGLNWTVIDIPGLDINGLQALGVKGGIIFGAAYDTVYKTSDNFSTISSQVYSSVSSTVTNMEIFNGRIFITSGVGSYYVSDDDGASWVMHKNQLTDGTVQDIHVIGSKYITTTFAGVFTSSDMGITWQWDNNGIIASQVLSLEAVGSYIFAGTHVGGIFRSGDQGQSWEQINTGLPEINGRNINSIIPVGSRIFIATDDDIYYTEDQGATWQLSYNPGMNTTVRSLAEHNGVLVAGVGETGVVISRDGGNTWDLASTNGLNTQTVYPSIFLNEDLIIVSTANGEVFLSNDLGNSWRQITITTGFYSVTEFQINAGIIYAATTRGLFYSEDGGNSWAPFNDLSFYISDMVFDQNLIYVSTRTGIYVADVMEKVWYGLCEGMGVRHIRSLVESDGVLYAGSFAHGVWKRNALSGTLPPENGPTAGIDPLILCREATPVDLYQQMGISPQSKGEWSPGLTVPGIFDPSTDTAGLYTFTFDNGICGCNDYRTIEIALEDGTVNPGEDSEISLCRAEAPVNLLDLMEGQPAPGGEWSPQLASGTDLFDPAIDQAGVYTYILDNACVLEVSSVDISIYEAEPFDEYKIDVTDLSYTNEIVVRVPDDRNFEFSLDGQNYQESPVFNGLPPGVYAVSGREINGCGRFKEMVMVVDYPRFFTPNGDGIHDTWGITDFPDNNYEVRIYDRFGKLLTVLDPNSPYWDGNYRGIPMPATDYWFTFVMSDGQERSGHFSLRR